MISFKELILFTQMKLQVNIRFENDDFYKRKYIKKTGVSILCIKVKRILESTKTVKSTIRLEVKEAKSR